MPRGNIDSDQIRSIAKSGDGTQLLTTKGTLTSGHGLVIDSTGNVVDSGSAPGSGGGGGAPTARTNYTSSGRAYGVAYQNTGSKPLYVSVWGHTSVSDQIFAKVNTFNPPTDIVAAANDTNTAQNATVFFIVLPGEWYIVDWFTGTKTIGGWFEWS